MFYVLYMCVCEYAESGSVLVSYEMKCPSELNANTLRTPVPRMTHWK